MKKSFFGIFLFIFFCVTLCASGYKEVLVEHRNNDFLLIISRGNFSEGFLTSFFSVSDNSLQFQNNVKVNGFSIRKMLQTEKELIILTSDYFEGQDNPTSKNTIDIVDKEKFNIQQSFSFPNDPIDDIAVSGKYFAIAFRNGKIQLFDRASELLLNTFTVARSKNYGINLRLNDHREILCSFTYNTLPTFFNISTLTGNTITVEGVSRPYMNNVILMDDYSIYDYGYMATIVDKYNDTVKTIMKTSGHFSFYINRDSIYYLINGYLFSYEPLTNSERRLLKVTEEKNLLYACEQIIVIAYNSECIVYKWSGESYKEINRFNI